MSARDKLSHLVINDEGFLFDSATGAGFVANPTALTILRALQDGRSEGAVVEELTSRFAVEPAEALDDVTDFLARLKTLQLC